MCYHLGFARVSLVCLALAKSAEVKFQELFTDINIIMQGIKGLPHVVEGCLVAERY